MIFDKKTTNVRHNFNLKGGEKMLKKYFVQIFILLICVCFLPNYCVAATDTCTFNYTAPVDRVIIAYSIHNLALSAITAPGQSQTNTYDAEIFYANHPVHITVTGTGPGQATPTFAKQKTDLQGNIVAAYDTLLTSWGITITAGETNPIPAQLATGSTPAQAVAFTCNAFSDDGEIRGTIIVSATSPPASGTVDNTDSADYGSYTCTLNIIATTL